MNKVEEIKDILMARMTDEYDANDLANYLLKWHNKKLEEYSSCKSPGMKWVKASERLPEYGKELNGKYGTLHVTVAFFEDEVCIRGFDSMKPTKKLLEQIFWLDESTTEELKEERCSICGAEKSEAYQCSTPECPFH